MAKALLALIRRFGFNYTWFRIYRLLLDDAAVRSPFPVLDGYLCREVTAAELEASALEELRACARYAGAGSSLFGVVRNDGLLACVQCIWFGDRYASESFWPVEPDAAVSMHLVTDPAQRGKGLATFVKRYSAHQLGTRGFTGLYSRIWWTNTASIRVSEKAGWERVGNVVEVKVPGIRRPWRVAVPRSPDRTRGARP